MRIEKGLRAPARKRKLALALSVSAMGLNTAAIGAGALSMPTVAQASVQKPDPRADRVKAKYIDVSDEMNLALIEEEGIHRTVYADPVGLLTVGVGHLVTPQDKLRAGQRISEARVAKLLEQDLQKASKAVDELVGDLPLYQHEYDALVDLVFNVGPGNVSPEKSPNLNAAIQSGDYEAIADELAYHNAQGQVLKGLQYRSDRRTAIFMDADYADPRQPGNSRIS